jgi:hypothetical protein
MWVTNTSIAERVPIGRRSPFSSCKAPFSRLNGARADAEKDMVHIRSDMTADLASEPRACS